MAKSFSELETMIERDAVAELSTWTTEQLKAARERQERRDYKARQHHDNKTSAAAMFLQVCIATALDGRP